jgi:hypothetical protein
MKYDYKYPFQLRIIYLNQYISLLAGDAVSALRLAAADV